MEIRKTCAACNNDFAISDFDQQFLLRLDIPHPTLCPPCRSARRMIYRNERVLVRRKCDITGKDIISIFRPDSGYTVCDKDEWKNVDPFSYGVDFDFSGKFFDQFFSLARRVPMQSLYVSNAVNSPYNQDVSRAENCYMCSRTHDSHDMIYTYRGNSSASCADSTQVIEQSENLYECVECISCNKSQFLHFCEQCANSSFLYNCVSCVDCFLCTNLRNKNYCIKNVQYSRDEYKKILDSYELHTDGGRVRALKEFEDLVLKTPRRSITILNSPASSGDNIVDSKNCNDCFGVKYSENCSHMWDVMKSKECMDAYSGGRNNQLLYEVTGTAGSYNCHFTVRCGDSQDCDYSIFVKNCKDCFGCVGLENQQYCIFNKQYTEEEYKALKSKIVSRMRETNEYGEFFPMSESPFPYNDTVANEYYPLSEELAKTKGLKWVDPVERNYTITKNTIDLPQTITAVLDEITNDVIACDHAGTCDHQCTKAFRIVAQELDFYRLQNIPLPRSCPNCRYYRRLAYKNPTTLREVICSCGGESSTNGLYKNSTGHTHGMSPCGEVCQTSYGKEKDTIIYCESCYKQEMY